MNKSFNSHKAINLFKGKKILFKLSILDRTQI